MPFFPPSRRARQRGSACCLLSACQVLLQTQDAPGMAWGSDGMGQKPWENIGIIVVWENGGLTNKNHDLDDLVRFIVGLIRFNGIDGGLSNKIQGCQLRVSPTVRW